MTTPVNTALLPWVCHRAKRQRGGQQGNQNARKHGFYAGRLSPAEICQFWNTINTEGIEPEIAALRVKLRSSLERDPGNRRVLREAAKLLARWYSSKYRLDKADSSTMKKLVWDIFKSYPGLSPCQPEQPPTPTVILTKRIECMLTICSVLGSRLTQEEGCSR